MRPAVTVLTKQQITPLSPEEKKSEFWCWFLDHKKYLCLSALHCTRIFTTRWRRISCVRSIWRGRAIFERFSAIKPCDRPRYDSGFAACRYRQMALLWLFLFCRVTEFFPQRSLMYTKSKSCFTVEVNGCPFNQHYAKKNSFTCMKEEQQSSVYKRKHK